MNGNKINIDSSHSPIKQAQTQGVNMMHTDTTMSASCGHFAEMENMTPDSAYVHQTYIEINSLYQIIFIMT